MSKHYEIEQRRAGVERDEKANTTKSRDLRETKARIQIIGSRSHPRFNEPFPQIEKQSGPTNASLAQSLIPSRSKTETPIKPSHNLNGVGKHDYQNVLVQTDPAIIIGLAMSFGRQGGLANVPDILLVPLCQAALNNCGASAALLKWLEHRPQHIKTMVGTQSD